MDEPDLLVQPIKTVLALWLSFVTEVVPLIFAVITLTEAVDQGEVRRFGCIARTRAKNLALDGRCPTEAAKLCVVSAGPKNDRDDPVSGDDAAGDDPWAIRRTRWAP